MRPCQPIRGFGAAWLSTIGIDLVVFTALQVLQVGSINYTPLFALPVLMGAVLGSGAVGLGTTAAATLLLLGDATWYWLRTAGATLAALRAGGLTGTGPFRGALLAMSWRAGWRARIFCFFAFVVFLFFFFFFFFFFIF